LPFELYVLAMMALTPLLSGLAASREFGQPLIYGVLAQRANILAAGALIILYLFRKELIAWRDVQGALLLLAWTTLGIYLLMHLLLDPAAFVEFGRGLVGGGASSEFEFKFRSEFIIFGFIFYAFLGFRNKSRRYWLLSLPFIGYLLIIEGGRSLLVSLFAAFFIFAVRWGSFSRLIALAPKILIAGMLLLALLYASNAAYVHQLAGKFADAFTALTVGERTEDASANSRILQAAIAAPYVKKHWIIGNGDLSKQWRGGYEGVLGGRFFPSDIGIVGVLYMYGSLGTLLFTLQFYFAYRYSRMASIAEEATPLLDAIKGFLLYFAIHSLVTGKFAHYSEIGLIFIALIYCFVLEQRAARPLHGRHT
jgi:hypothetical protein